MLSIVRYRGVEEGVGEVRFRRGSRMGSKFDVTTALRTIDVQDLRALATRDTLPALDNNTPS